MFLMKWFVAYKLVKSLPWLLSIDEYSQYTLIKNLGYFDLVELLLCNNVLDSGLLLMLYFNKNDLC